MRGGGEGMTLSLCNDIYHKAMFGKSQQTLFKNWFWTPIKHFWSSLQCLLMGNRKESGSVEREEWENRAETWGMGQLFWSHTPGISSLEKGIKPWRVAYWTAETAAHAAKVWNQTADDDLTGVCFTCPANAYNNTCTSWSLFWRAAPENWWTELRAWCVLAWYLHARW